MNGWNNTEKIDFLKAMGKRIKDKRKFKGMTEERLAEETGLSIDTVKKVEKGATDAKTWSLYRICEVLDLSLDYITKGSSFVIDGKIPVRVNQKLTLEQIEYLSKTFHAQAEIYTEQYCSKNSNEALAKK